MKFKRTERIGAIVKILSDNPNKIFTLSHFITQFNAAKSTISEDLLVVKNVFEKLELGKVITISGAAGGVKYIPKTSKSENEAFAELKKNMDNYSLADLEKEAKVIFADHVASIGTFSIKEDNKKTTSVKTFTNVSSTKKTNSRYGNLKFN